MVKLKKIGLDFEIDKLINPIENKYMKLFLIILFFIGYSLKSSGQKYSVPIDSLADLYISFLSHKQKKYIDDILKARIKTGWINRIDTTNFDYVFITEKFDHYRKFSEINVTEEYFNKTDTISSVAVFNGKKNILAKSRTSLSSFIDYYKMLKPTQELNYDSTQIWYHGCVIHDGDREEFTKRRIKELKKTYQIQTMVDRINNKIVISIQYAPKYPKFNTIGRNPVWDF